MIETAKGKKLRCVVSEHHIVDSRSGTIAGGQEARLVLVTCYPFDAIVPGGPLRYIVVAKEKETAQALDP